MLMDILAGVVSGLVMATVFLGAGIFVLFANRDIYERLERRLPGGLSPAVIMLLMLLAAPIVWGALGAIAGAFYTLAADNFPDAGLGSSNFAFTLSVLALTALVTLVFILARRELRRVVLIVAIAFAGIFGWLLPLLATWR